MLKQGMDMIFSVNISRIKKKKLLKIIALVLHDWVICPQSMN